MVSMETPSVEGMRDVVGALRDWQGDGVPFQLHPGDIGWYWRHGPARTAADTRVWRSAGRIAAIGLLDGPDLLRVAVAPELQGDEALATVLVDDIVDPDRTGPREGEFHLETPNGTAVRDALSAAGWPLGEEWTVLRRELTEPVADPGLRMEVAGPRTDGVRLSAEGAAPGSTRFQADRWRSLAANIPFPDARCLIAHDADDEPVAVITVWSSGPGRPGLIEPLGVEPNHRGRGHGRAIVLAGCAALRELGSSSVLVASQSFNTGALRTYVAAGFVPIEIRRDLDRPAASVTG